ncbi:MAG: hypothetical protein ABSF64_40355 [Bryobacteraceae bacterium]|jgi:hypothetical protein
MWFTELAGNEDSGEIVRICATASAQGCSAVGQMTEYPIPPPGTPFDITTGPDGALWFTDTSLQQIGRITVSGRVAEYPVDPGYDGLLYITPGADGTLWFLNIYDGDYGELGQITTSGEFVGYYIVGGFSNALATGPDGAIWIGNWYSGTIEQVFTTARRNGIDMCATCTAPSASELIQLQEAGVKYAVVEGSQEGSSNPLKLLTKFSCAGVKTAVYCFYTSRRTPPRVTSKQRHVSTVLPAVSAILAL